MWNRKELKAKGKAAFMANYWKCVLIGILLAAFVAGAAVSTGRTAHTGLKEKDDSGTSAVSEIQNTISEEQIREAMQDPEVRRAVREVFAAIGLTLLTVWLVCICLRLLVFNPIEVGCRGFFARNTDAPAGMDEVKAGFHPYGRTVGAMLLRDLFLFLWGLLFVVPGVIKRYSYRMVPYILADDPTISGREAIALSHKMMNGHKWNTFVLDLSFIGWDLLSILTAGLLGVFYVNPYQFSTGAELYQTLKQQ